MELHQVIRELVDEHGRSILDDASGFRAMLDDVLDEESATPGDINLLADAIRFDTLASLVAMVEGGAGPESAVAEAGARLARSRGDNEPTASGWAAAVLGYAVGAVPEPVLDRYRAMRPVSASRPPAPPPSAHPPFSSPSGAATAAPRGWPSSEPPRVAPGSGTVPPPPVAAGSWPAAPPSGPVHSGSIPAPTFGAVGGPAPSGRSRRGLWIAIAAVVALVVGGGILTAVLLGGDDGPGGGGGGGDTDEVDLTAAALDERYDALSATISTGTSDCTAPETGEGEEEVVECATAAGTLRLVTYDSEEALKAAREERVDTRIGTLSGPSGSGVFYEYDPENSTSDDAAVVYWDSASGRQSAELTGADGAKLESLTAIFTNTDPRVTAPTAPQHPLVREFIGINMSVADCERNTSFVANSVEQSLCLPNDDVSVYVGRLETRRDLTGQRRYYRRQWREAEEAGQNDYWRFGTDGAKEGDFYGYIDAGEPVLYWDWDKGACRCYAVAFGFGITLEELNTWWAS